MRPTQLFAVLFFLALSWKCNGEAADQCPAQQPIYGKALKGFTFTSLASPTAFGCLVDCHYEDRCQSYNYVMKTNICEMNNRTKEAKPEQFVSDPDRFYMKRGAHRKQLGSIPALTAQSCKEIKANEGGQAVSSNSWLDPSGSGNVILAYCDMNTEVADFCIRHRCQNGASCVNGHVNYTCLCNAGWTGTHCDSSMTGKQIFMSFKQIFHISVMQIKGLAKEYLFCCCTCVKLFTFPYLVPRIVVLLLNAGKE
ncbi:hypothetical protein ACROYT_G003902 [Oculina patagonica]